MLRILTFCLGICGPMAGFAHASLTVLVGEPFGNWGTIMPVGHVSLYLDRVCADGPVKLRMCVPGEPQGAVIARLDKIGQLDWISSPVLDFLYGTSQPDQFLPFTTQDTVDALRQSYRREHLAAYFPDGTQKIKQNREWWETVGVLYSRKVYAYQLDTTRQQDEQFVALMNSTHNRHAYRLHKKNCADFVADAVNFYYPGIVRSNHAADFALMTPKQVARCVWNFGEQHPETHFRMYEMPQVPGTLRRSRPVRGSAEMVLKTKRYLATLLLIQPELVVTCEILYLHRGRWSMDQGGPIEEPLALVQKTELPTVASR